MSPSPRSWSWQRPAKTPEAGDITLIVTIQWGLAKLMVTTSPNAPRIWLHGASVSATARSRVDGRESADTHRCAIREPIRMSPSGRYDEAWRPARFDLDDGSLHRPAFDASVSVSVDRQDPIAIRPQIEVVDDFAWIDGRYELVEGTPLWHETHRPPEGDG